MLWKILLVFTAIWMMISRWQRRKMIALGKQLGGKSLALPFIGHAYLFLGDDEDRMKAFQLAGEQAMQRGGLLSHWQGNKLYVVVADPEPAEFLLKTCLDKDDVLKFFRVLLGNGSVFAPVPIWRPRRKILAPTFSPKNLNSFVNIFSQQSKIMADQLRTVAGKGTFSIWKYITSYTLDAVCETTLGIKMNSQLQPKQPFLLAFENCCKIDAKRVCQPWLYNDTLYRYFCTDSYETHSRSKEFIWNFMNNIITSKREAMKEQKLDFNNQKEVPDLKSFLEILIENSGGDNGYSNIELREETLVIVSAGTDTSATGAAYCVVNLAQYPDVQEKIFQELQDVFGNSDRPVIPEDLPHLKYLDAVIRETLRLYPPVPVIARQVTSDVTIPSGVTLVKGCGIIICIWSIHRNPKYWGDDADQFKPERFLDNPLPHPAAFMPFSHGPRSCIGYQYAMMSMKTALANLLRQYHVKPASDVRDNAKPIRVKFDIMMKDVQEFAVQIESRS